MNVAIIKGQSQILKQVQRSLSLHQIKGDLVDKITNRLLVQYDFLIVHSEQIPKIPERVIEQIVLQKQIVLIYIHRQSNLSGFVQLTYDPYFLPIQQINVVETLPGILNNVYLWQKEVRVLKDELKASKTKLKNKENMIKAKSLLIESGYSEQEAHNWIQTTAMEKRMKKTDIVNLIIEQNIDF